MDVNMLYQKLIELSDLLKENREKTQGVVANAEAYAAQIINAEPDISLVTQESSPASSSAHLAELARENFTLRNAKDLLLREQRENSKLLGEYENAIGEILDKVRSMAFEREREKSSISHEYNQLLQDEKDAHLRTRLERDEWHSRFLQGVEMLRRAYHIRSKEDEEPFEIISGLQNEIQGYRQALGLGPGPKQPDKTHEYEVPPSK